MFSEHQLCGRRSLLGDGDGGAKQRSPSSPSTSTLLEGKGQKWQISKVTSFNDLEYLKKIKQDGVIEQPGGPNSGAYELRLQKSQSWSQKSP